MVDLKPHNQTAYQAVINALKDHPRTCVIHPTGTGKSFIALKIIEDNPDAKIAYITSCAMNLLEFYSKIKALIGDRRVRVSLYKAPKADEIIEEEAADGIDEDEASLDALIGEAKSGEDEKIILSLYAGLKEPFTDLDLILLDEFHRAGAELWEQRVRNLLDVNPSAKVIGFSATPIRYLDDKRDMSQELFDGNIASEITLHDAIVDELLPAPEYITATYEIEEIFYREEERLSKLYKKNTNKYNALLEAAKRLLENSSGIDALFREKMSEPKGKYIIFCRTIEHMKRMLDESISWFYWADSVHRYSISGENHHSHDIYQEFLNDNTDCLRLLFCVDMLNEGVHIPDINGVILLRPTMSLNIYFQQIGRALAVGNKKIQIFDIVENAILLKPVQEFWNGVIIAEQNKGKPIDVSFEIYARDVELLKLLEEMQRCVLSSWEYNYFRCAEYFKANGSLSGITNYDVSLKQWISNQRARSKYLSEEQKDKLDAIGMVWEFDDVWEENYALAERYFKEHGNLLIASKEPVGMWLSKQRYRQNNGIMPQEQIERLDKIGMVWKLEDPWDKRYELAKEYYEETGNINASQKVIYKGVRLGSWIALNRWNKRNGQLSQDKIDKLNALGMVWDRVNEWNDHYDIAKKYYQEFGHLEPKAREEYMGFKLEEWVRYCRRCYREGHLSEEKIEQLNQIGMRWGKGTWWEQKYRIAKKYYKEHDNLEVPYGLILEGINLRDWLQWNRRQKKSGKLSKDKIDKLTSIGMKWKIDKWTDHYNVAAAYYREKGHLNVKKGEMYQDFKLGVWIIEVRHNRKTGKLSDERIAKMDAIGMKW